MKLSKNFSLAEFCKSQTATRLGLDNTPTQEHIDNAVLLAVNVLQPVRENFGPTVINSGYRGAALNKAVGGSSKSQHCKGQAADIECIGHSNYDVAVWIRDNLEFDQLILEGYKSGDPRSGWVHVSFNKEGNRKKVMTADFSTGKAVYSMGLNK